MSVKIGRGLFIAATDTGVGKTWVTLALMEALRLQGLKVAGMKPVATGCAETEYGLRSDDAIQIQAHATTHHDYDLINSYAFRPPVSPHVAAERANIIIDLYHVAEACRKLAAVSDCVLVEGVGGWRVPLGQDRTLVDLVRILELPVVLVVGLRLGCINHALLTAECMRIDEINLCGWVANRLEPGYLEPEKTLEFLERHIPAPCLGVLPHLAFPDPMALAAHVNPARLQKAIICG
jgi:dethiobiotin synthetase